MDFRCAAIEIRQALRGVLAMVLGTFCASAQEDPFADLSATTPVSTNAVERAAPSWTDNLLFRKELYVLSGLGYDNFDQTHDVLSRVSAGFEVQKRFATALRTVASFDYQGRIVYRNHRLDTRADAMGAHAETWEYETHNAYLDFYNVVGEPGRFNLRVGYFYQPFGLNQQTDTHGTLLQLSNDDVFGAERDWQLVLYGALSDDLDYAAGYLLGTTDFDDMVEGQSGLAVFRVLLNNEWLFEQGLEGGLSLSTGERVDEEAMMRRSGMRHAMHHGYSDPVIRTHRAGADLRKRFISEMGTFTLTAEAATGLDEDDLMAVGLGEAGWLHPSRRLGTALQYRHYWTDREDATGSYTDARVTGVVTYYFKNDVGNAHLHWIALGVERQVHQTDDDEDTFFVIQYYWYW